MLEIQSYLEEITYYLYDIKNDRTELKLFIDTYKEDFPEKLPSLEKKLQVLNNMPEKIQIMMDKLIILEKEIKAVEEWKEPNK